MFVATTTNTYRSVDGGGSWAAVLTGEPGNISYVPSSPMTVYASYGQTIYVSTDGGGTFPTTHMVPNQTLDTVVVGPSGANDIYFSGKLGLFSLIQ